MNRRGYVVAVGLLVAAVQPAFAHHFMDNTLPQTWLAGLLSGLGHPLIGLDHAAFIIAAGFLLGFVERGAWGLAALAGGALTGAAAHLYGVALPGGEVLVAASVVLTGVLVALSRRLPLAWLAAGLALAGALHGHAYAETIFGAEPAPLAAYLAGFTLIQLAVAGAAYACHRWLTVRLPARVSAVSATVGFAAGLVGSGFLIAAIGG